MGLVQAPQRKNGSLLLTAVVDSSPKNLADFLFKPGNHQAICDHFLSGWVSSRDSDGREHIQLRERGLLLRRKATVIVESAGSSYVTFRHSSSRARRQLSVTYRLSDAGVGRTRVELELSLKSSLSRDRYFGIPKRVRTNYARTLDRLRELAELDAVLRAVTVGGASRGDVFENRVTGERTVVLLGPGDGAGDRLVVHLSVKPGGAVIGEHMHPAITERFRVLRGSLMATVDGEELALEPGDDITVPPGVLHNWWNASEGPTEVVVDIEPARRFEMLVSTTFGLANDGRTNDKGIPSFLQLAVIAHNFRDTIRFAKPPLGVQRIVFAVFNVLGRIRGYQPYYSKYFAPIDKQVPAADALALLGDRELEAQAQSV